MTKGVTKQLHEGAALFAALDWRRIAGDMHENGYASVSNVLPHEICNAFIADYDKPGIYRKTVVMERYRFGLGEYKYFDYPLPPLVEAVRETVYPHLEHVANDWMRLLKIDTRFPSTFGELRDLCHASGQQKPTPLILKYGVGGFNTLHQDLYGEVYFPIQLAFFLNEPDVDYTNGEFVLTQQTPRAQSKAIVLRPRKGDMIIFTTNFRPVRGSHGFYRANMRHGVSEVLSGQRYTLGLIFHDATS